MVAEALATMQQGERTDLRPNGLMSQDEAASLLNVSPRSVKRAAAVKREAPELAEKVAAGEMTLGAATHSDM